MQHLIDQLRNPASGEGPLTAEPAAIAALSDAQLVCATARAIERPKRSRATSFTLHAPLELLARAGLLPLAPPRLRTAARLRIAAIAAEYAEGEEIDAPSRSFPDPEYALGALRAALRDADADGADAAIAYLARRMPVHDLVAGLTDEVAPRLGAAAHAPLLFAALADATGRNGDLATLLRAPVRALAAEGRARLSWIDSDDEAAADAGDLFDALAAPEHVASTSLFIAPTMLAVEADGRAARILSRATAHISPIAARRVLARVAALSMLHDDPRHAPYGWSHCLSLPQGVLALAVHSRDPRRLVRIAATHALGFRATLGRVRLARAWSPPAPSPDITALAGRAAGHPDAHLVKYTLACLAAAADDIEARPLLLGAAAFLGAWWDANPGAGFDA